MPNDTKKIYGQLLLIAPKGIEMKTHEFVHYYFDLF